MFHGVGTGKTITAVVASHYYFKVVPRGRRAETDAEIILYNNLFASLARKLNPRARASTGRSRQGHCAPALPEWDAAGALVYRTEAGGSPSRPVRISACP